ncbi:interferon-induced very large GTPase 1-like, partial [Arapaima gigas]
MSGLRPGNEYMVSLCTMLVCNRLTSAAAFIKIQTKPSPPVNLKVKEVKSRSVMLCWERPEDMEGVLYGYNIMYSCDEEQPKSEMVEFEASEVTLSDLKPGVQYSFTIVTVLQGGGRSSGSSTHVCTKPAPPVNLKVEEVKTTSVTLCWERPKDMKGVYYKYIISYSCGREQPESETHESHICSAVLSGLKPGVEYNVTVSTVLHDGAKSNENSTHVLTLPSSPRDLKVKEVKSRSVILCWERPEDMEEVPYGYDITYSCDGEQPKSEMVESEASEITLSDLKPGVQYSFTIVTVLQGEGRSSGSSTHVCTKPVPPVNLKVEEVNTTSVTLCWERPKDMEGVYYKAEYNVTVRTVLHDGAKSNGNSTHVLTLPSSPRDLKVNEVKSRSVMLCWERPEDMEGVPYGYEITYSCDGEQPKSEMVESEASEITLSDLKPGVQYSFTIVTVLQGGRRSRGSSTHVCTKPVPPVNLKVEEVNTTSVTLCWERPKDMEGVYY